MSYIEQPTEDGIAGKLYVPARQGGGKPEDVWGMSLWPSDLADPYTGDGLLVAGPSVDLAAKTGFTPVNRATAQLVFRDQAGSSGCQMEGAVVGAYFNSLDILGTGADPATDEKMMLSPSYLWSTPFAVFPNGVAALVGNLELQVPFAVGGTGTNQPITYATIDHQFIGPGGVKISVGLKAFGTNGVGSLGTGYDAPSQSYMCNGPIGPSNDQTYVTALQGCVDGSGATWTGFRRFHYAITYQNFKAVLQRLNTDFPGVLPSLDPSDYTFSQWHLNAETHTRGGHAELGWSMRNFSLASGSASVLRRIVIQDTTPPSVPLGLAAAPVSSSGIDLTWNASTDTGGSLLAGYRVYRNGFQIAQVVNPAYQDRGLSASTTYSYGVSAFDGSGNESAQSSPPVQATTQGQQQSVAPPILLALPNGAVGSPYSVSLPALNNEASQYTSWSLVAVSSNKKAANGTFTAPAPGNSFAVASNGVLSCNALASVEVDYIQASGTGPGGSVTRNYVVNVGPAGTSPLILAGGFSLGFATLGQPFAAAVKAVGNAWAVTYSLTGHTGPNAYAVDPTTGVVSGTPTIAGVDVLTIQATDGVNTTSQPYYITARQYVTGAPRPAGNSGSGWFTRDGELYEPSGKLFRMRGVNRGHVDASDGFYTHVGLNGNFNTVRLEHYGSFSAAYHLAKINTHLNNKQFVVYARFNNDNAAQGGSDPLTYYTGCAGGGANTGGDTNKLAPIGLRVMSADVFRNRATYAALYDKVAFNLANEYGPPNTIGVADVAWRDMYRYVAGNIVSYSGNTIHLGPGPSNPFAVCPIGLVTGVGVADQVIAITARGGDASDWTVQSSVALGTGTGGQLYGGGIGIYRGFGCKAPLMIDSGKFGQSWLDLIQSTYVDDILASDPEHNIIFSIHLYGYSSGNYVPDNIAWVRTQMSSMAAVRARCGACFVCGEFGPYLSGQSSEKTQLKTPDLVKLCEEFGIGYLGWSADDHNLANSHSDDSTFCMVYSDGAAPTDVGQVSNKTVWGKTFLLDPIYGTAANAKAPT